MLCWSPGVRVGWGSQEPCTRLELLYKHRFANMHLSVAVVNLLIFEGRETISIHENSLQRYSYLDIGGFSITTLIK